MEGRKICPGMKLPFTVDAYEQQKARKKGPFLSHTARTCFGSIFYEVTQVKEVMYSNILSNSNLSLDDSCFDASTATSFIASHLVIN